MVSSPVTKPLCPSSVPAYTPPSTPAPFQYLALPCNLPSFFAHDSILRSDSPSPPSLGSCPSLSCPWSLPPPPTSYFFPAQFPFPNKKRQQGLPSPLLPSPATVWGCLDDRDEHREIGKSGEGGSGSRGRSRWCKSHSQRRPARSRGWGGSQGDRDVGKARERWREQRKDKQNRTERRESHEK